MFEMLRECEPWDRFCDRHSQTIGYFNLFHLKSPTNRYVESIRGSDSAHDDWHFTTSFPPERIRQLPMTVIHTGPPGANWGGRVARSYQAEGTDEASDSVPSEIAGTGSVAMVGYFPGNRWREVARRFAKVLLVDHFQVHQPSGSPMVEADRVVLREMWAKEAAECTNVELMGTHSAGTLERIPDGSLAVLYLPGEVTPDWLVAAVPHWLRKLRDDAILCGDLYGLPYWPDATYAIALLLGVPAAVSANGFWWGRKRSGLVRALPQVSETDGREVVLVNEGTVNLDRLLVTMHQVRQNWDGRLRLFHWGEVNQALRIAAARCGVELMEAGASSGDGSGAVSETLDAGHWRQAIYLPSGALVFGGAEKLFTLKAETAEFSTEKPWRMEGGGKATKNGCLPACHANHFEELAVTTPTVLLCTGPMEAWTDAAWAVWSEAMTAMTVQLAAEIRVAANATIAFLVGPEEIDEFEQVWLSLKFAPAVPVIIGLVGIAAEDVWLAPTGTEPQVLSLPATQAPRRQLGTLLAAVQTRRVILLPPNIRPLPGAELFPGVKPDDEVILNVGSDYPSEENEPVTESLIFGIFLTEALRRVCMEDVCGVVDQPINRLDLARKGWLLKAPITDPILPFKVLA